MCAHWSSAKRQGAREEEAIMAIRRTVSLAVLMLASGMTPALADMAAAEKWVNDEFQPSTLSKDEQLKEMEWFIKAAEPFKGMEVNVLSETIPTHTYESETLTKAFEEITGIKVNHQYLGEGEVVQAVQTQMQTNRNLYDAYINDSDLIGTHSRLQSAVNLTSAAEMNLKSATNMTIDCGANLSVKAAVNCDVKAVNITAQGELYFQKVIPEVFAAQGQITIAAGALTLDATAF